MEKPTAEPPGEYYVFEGEQGKRDSIVVVARLSRIYRPTGGPLARTGSAKVQLKSKAEIGRSKQMHLEGMNAGST
uniref:Uncharacterized protein n=1 Tax=Salmonella sp. TaxID=599 RepID=A0A482ET55_SALSP|nr:hypothetical protein NNIBIDOC_00020 [Salmonella sp.]